MNEIEPRGRIQWQGTDVCIDIYCECGASSHIDANSLFMVKCGACGRVWALDPHIKLRKLDFEPENIPVTTDL